MRPILGNLLVAALAAYGLLAQSPETAKRKSSTTVAPTNAPKAVVAKKAATAKVTPQSAGKTASKKAVPQASAKTTPPAAAKTANPGAKTTSKSGTKKPVATVARRSAQQQPTSDRYREIQQALSDRGYFGGAPDGTWGPESVDALKRFQREQNLTDDGKIGSLSLIALGLGPQRVAISTAPKPETAVDTPTPAP